MVRERDDHARRPGEAACSGPTKIVTAPASQEAVDQLLRQRAVDLGGVARGALAAVRARVVDVHVEAVLVAGVPDVAEPRAEVAAVAGGSGRRPPCAGARG